MSALARGNPATVRAIIREVVSAASQIDKDALVHLGMSRTKRRVQSRDDILPEPCPDDWEAAWPVGLRGEALPATMHSVF